MRAALKAAAWTLCSIIAFAIVFSAADWAIQKYENHYRAAHGQDGYEYEAPLKGPIVRWCVETLERHHEPILAAFTVILAGATIGLWFQTKTLAVDTNETGKKQVDLTIATDRAYVFADLIIMESTGSITVSAADPVRRRGIQVRIRLKNHGKTPAILVKVVAGVKITKGEPDRTGLTDVPAAAGRVISFPDAGPLEPDVYSVVESDYEAAQGPGTLNLYCVGRVDYLDVLKVPRWTEFRWRCDFKALYFEPFADPKGRDWA